MSRSYTPHFSDVANRPSTLVGLGIAGLAAGGGARLGKSLFETLSRPSATVGPKRISRRRAPGAAIPVEITEEEAEELRRKGVKVREILSKTARSRTGPSSAWGGFGMGATAVAAGMAGWGLTDYIVNSLRRRAAKSDNDRIRERIQALLEDAPEGVDGELYGQMKAAEAAFISDDLTKTAALGVLSDIGDMWNTAKWSIPAIAGGSAVFHLLSGLRSAYADSRAVAKVRARRDAADRMRAVQGEAFIQPVVRRSAPAPASLLNNVPQPEEEEEEKPVVDAVITRSGGSPAAQATTNTAVQSAASTQSASSWF